VSNIEIIVPDASLGQDASRLPLWPDNNSHSHVGALPFVIVRGAKITVVLKIEMPLVVA